MPSIIDLEKNISFRIVNNHRSMMNPRPQMPGMAYVAGIHIKQPKKLPTDIQKFMDNANNEGVIYLSFGSCIRSVDLPAEKLNALLDTFRTLKQKVLWKFENETIPNLPSNVMIRKWLPQNDLLAHRNLKLFITHGGVFGTQEGVYHGVPMLFIPIYSDQFRNAMRCVHAGYAEMVRFQHLTTEILTEKVNLMLSDKKYSEEAKEVSKLFRDNPIDPMDDAMYWIEYVARYPRAKVFKSSAVNMPWYIYLHLDIVAMILVSLWLLQFGIKSIVNRLFRQNKPHVQINGNVKTKTS